MNPGARPGCIKLLQHHQRTGQQADAHGRLYCQLTMRAMDADTHKASSPAWLS